MEIAPASLQGLCQCLRFLGTSCSFLELLVTIDTFLHGRIRVFGRLRKCCLQPQVKSIDSKYCTYSLEGFLDLVLVMRWNLAIGVPDTVFIFGDELIGDLILRFNTMPLFVLAACKSIVGSPEAITSYSDLPGWSRSNPFRHEHGPLEFWRFVQQFHRFR